MKTVVMLTFLEMDRPSEARLAFPEIGGLCVRRAAPNDAGIYRSLYQEVGRNHLWMSRSRWSEADFSARIAQKNVRAWLALLDSTPCGLVELCEKEEGIVDIALLAVSPRFAGRGIGKYLLSLGVKEAWKLNPGKVRTYTRSSDGEHALRNYESRGFRVHKRWPEIVVFPKERQSEAMDVIRRSRERGIYPGPAVRVLAHLRESLAGQGARQAVYQLRRLVGWLRRRVTFRTAEPAKRTLE